MCGEAKPLVEFKRDKRRPLGIGTYCKICAVVATQDYKTRNLDTVTVRHREANRKYATTHPGRKQESSRKWAQANPDKIRAKEQRRRARKVEATVEPFTAADLFAHWEAIGAYACVYCGGPYEHSDHIMPLALGGEHSVENLLPLCADCNLSKGARDPWEWAESRFPHAVRR
jgi:5-methylcytosine-specific restriction endonuclease McrA